MITCWVGNRLLKKKGIDSNFVLGNNKEFIYFKFVVWGEIMP